LSSWFDLCAHKAKFFYESTLPCIKISLLIVKDYSISDQPDRPIAGDDDFPEDGASKGFPRCYNHIKWLQIHVPADGNGVPAGYTERAFKKQMKECFFMPCGAKNTAIIFKKHILPPQKVSCIEPVSKKKPEEKLMFAQVT